MKAIVRDRYGSPDVLHMDEIDTPAPGHDQVLVRVHAASLNTADSDLLRGRPRVARLGTGLRRPKTRRVGLDVAGRVEAVGRTVTALRPGDEVWADLFAFGHGSFAEYVCAPATAFAPKPTSTTFEKAATVPHSGILALQGLLGKGPIRPGQKVLINGAGGCVGPFAVQIAKSFRAEVTGVDHTSKLDMLRAIGADHVIDYTHEDFTRNGQRYDLILDIAANRSILHYRRALSADGRYVLIARSLGGFLQALLLGACISLASSKRMGVFTWVANKREDLDLLSELLEGGRIKPLIDKRYGLEEIPQAFQHLEQGLARGKLVVLP